MLPLRQKLLAGKEIIKLEEISYIFSCVETILEAHRKLLNKLEEIHCNDWPHCRGFGEVIVKETRVGLIAYGAYVANFVNAQDTVTRLRSDRNSKFSLWLQEVESKPGARTLQFLLSEPLNHISKMEGCVNVSFSLFLLRILIFLVHETIKFFFSFLFSEIIKKANR